MKNKQKLFWRLHKWCDMTLTSFHVAHQTCQKELFKLMSYCLQVFHLLDKEYDEAKTSFIEGKSCGEDGIPQEVLKRCHTLLSSVDIICVNSI